MYVDGRQEGTQYGRALANGVDPFIIGATFSGGRLFPFKGAIDELAVFHRALTENDVKSLYGQYTGGAGLCSATSQTSCSYALAIQKGTQRSQSIYLTNTGIIAWQISIWAIIRLASRASRMRAKSLSLATNRKLRWCLRSNGNICATVACDHLSR